MKYAQLFSVAALAFALGWVASPSGYTAIVHSGSELRGVKFVPASKFALSSGYAVRGEP